MLCLFLKGDLNFRIKHVNFFPAVPVFSLFRISFFPSFFYFSLQASSYFSVFLSLEFHFTVYSCSIYSNSNIQWAFWVSKDLMYVGFLSTKKVLRILGTLVFSFIFFFLYWHHRLVAICENVHISFGGKNVMCLLLSWLGTYFHACPLSPSTPCSGLSTSTMYFHCQPIGASLCYFHTVIFSLASIPEDGLLQPVPSMGLTEVCSCSHRTLAASCQQLCFHTPKQTQCLVLILSCTDFVVLVRWAVSAAIWVTPWEPQGVPSPCRKPATVPFSHLLICLPHALAVQNGGDTTGQVNVEDIHVLLLLEWLWTDLSQEFLGFPQFNKSCLWWWMWVTCK